MKNNILNLAIVLTVGMILAGSLMMPVINDAAATTDTFKNEGYFYLDEIDADTTRTIFWDHTAPNQLTIDTDNVVSLPTNVSVTTVCSGDNWMVRHSPNSLFQLYITNGGVSASVNDGTDLTITISGGTLTAVNTASTPVTKSVTFTDAYCITYEDKADYVMKKSDAVAYMNADSPIFGEGRSNIGSQIGVAILVEGTVEDVNITEISSYSATFGDPTIVMTANSAHNDLYELQKITFTGTVGTESSDLTYSYFIVPSTVTAERSVHFAPGEIVLIETIPIMVIVALLMFSVGGLYLRRSD